MGHVLVSMGRVGRCASGGGSVVDRLHRWRGGLQAVTPLVGCVPTTCTVQRLKLGAWQEVEMKLGCLLRWGLGGTGLTADDMVAVRLRRRRH